MKVSIRPLRVITALNRTLLRVVQLQIAKRELPLDIGVKASALYVTVLGIKP